MTAISCQSPLTEYGVLPSLSHLRNPSRAPSAPPSITILDEASEGQSGEAREMWGRGSVGPSIAKGTLPSPYSNPDKRRPKQFQTHPGSRPEGVTHPALPFHDNDLISCFGEGVGDLHVLAVPGIEWLKKLQPVAVGVHRNFPVAARWCLVGFLTCRTGFSEALLSSFS
jgi:hypothetical protein